MRIRNLAAWVVILSVWFFLLVVTGLRGFDIFYFQFIISFSIFFLLHKPFSIFFVFIILFISDSILATPNQATSFLIFSIGGFLVAILSEVFPLKKQKPFLAARLVWLMICICLFILIRSGFSLEEIFEIKFLLIIFVNVLLLLINTYFIEIFLLEKSSSGNETIVIS